MVLFCFLLMVWDVEMTYQSFRESVHSCIQLLCFQPIPRTGMNAVTLQLNCKLIVTLCIVGTIGALFRYYKLHITGTRNVMKLWILDIIHQYKTSSFIAWNHLILIWLLSLQSILKSRLICHANWKKLKPKCLTHNRLIYHTKSMVFI